MKLILLNWGFRRYTFRLGLHEYRVIQQAPGTAHQTAICDVKHRPFNEIEVQEVAHAPEDDSIEQIADRSTQNQSECHA